jgi:hypothetical protein
VTGRKGEEGKGYDFKVILSETFLLCSLWRKFKRSMAPNLCYSALSTVYAMKYRAAT